ncbi:MAG: hypothetical protein AAFX80_24205, partial [Cyanobacteria bacterium J06639_18]
GLTIISSWCPLGIKNWVFSDCLECQDSRYVFQAQSAGLHQQKLNMISYYQYNASDNYSLSKINKCDHNA